MQCLKLLPGQNCMVYVDLQMPVKSWWTLELSSAIDLGLGLTWPQQDMECASRDSHRDLVHKLKTDEQNPQEIKWGGPIYKGKPQNVTRSELANKPWDNY